VKKATKNRLITIFILLIFLGSSLAYAFISAFPTGSSSDQWQARIIITINEDQYPIPSDIGIVGNETKGKIFTGNTNGIIYKTVNGYVTLKDFFDTWGQTFNSTCVLDYCNTNTSSVKMYTWNGKWVTNSAFEFYVIKSGDNILIDYR
jgi:hypothetical protein